MNDDMHDHCRHDDNQPGDDESGADSPGEAGLDVCPFPCETCLEPGDCEDCLDCLFWPEAYVDPPARPQRHVRSDRVAPSFAASLATARDELGALDRIGLAVRSYRREHHLSQRALAARMCVSRSTISRLETDPSGVPLGRAEQLLGALGWRLEVRPDGDDHEPDPLTWGVDELVARDNAGRRFPPFGDLETLGPDEQVSPGGHWDRHQLWRWQRPQPWPGA